MITTSVNDICNEYPAQDRYLIEKFNSLMRIRVKRLGGTAIISSLVWGGFLCFMDIY